MELTGDIWSFWSHSDQCFNYKPSRTVPNGTEPTRAADPTWGRTAKWLMINQVNFLSNAIKYISKIRSLLNHNNWLVISVSKGTENGKCLWVVFILADEIKNQTLPDGFSKRKSIVCIMVPW